MATNNNATRTTLAKRAAITLVVCVELTLCGCRSPWRSWRSEEPSLEQLLMHPEPWDAEARLQQEAPSRRSGSAQNVAQNGAKNDARKNPYAARDAAARDVLARRAEDAGEGEEPADASADEASRAEFEAAYAAAPPHLRGLLKRQWDATQARNAKLRTASDADLETDAIGADGEVHKGNDANAHVAVARSSRANDSPASFHMSDNDDAVDVDDANPDEAGGSEADRLHENNAERSSSDEGAVTYSLKNRERSSTSRLPLEDLAPPPVRKAARRVSHAEPVDTGAGDEVLITPTAVSSQRDSQRSAAATDKSKLKKAPPQQSASHVATASAVVKSDPGAPPVSETTPVIDEEKEKEKEVSEATEMAWRDHVREALRQLEAESSTENPAEQLHRQATSRMLRLTLGELEPALKPIEGLQSHEQEFFRHEFQALHDAIDPKGNPVLSRRWTLALDSHRKALAHLSAVSNLEIKNANFCTDVHSYGVISKFSSPHFKPNQELLLYCELDNFSAEPVKDGYETQLQGSYEIVDAGGRRVADMLLPEDADICRNQRRDYFIAYRIYMPQKIEPGRYQLRLTIEDMKGRKFGQTALDFQIEQ